MIDEQAILSLLDPETAAQFRAFVKHRPIFNVLNNAGVFATRNGQVLLNFNHHGTITKVSVTTIYDPTRSGLDKLL